MLVCCARDRLLGGLFDRVAFCIVVGRGPPYGRFLCFVLGCFFSVGLRKKGDSQQPARGLAVTVPIFAWVAVTVPILLGSLQAGSLRYKTDLTDLYYACGDHHCVARLCVGRLALEWVDVRAVRIAIFTGCRSM